MTQVSASMCADKACLYCKSKDPTKFEGVEHVIPQAFGTFGSETPTLSCVCDDCNSHFGKNNDEYLARETVEGVVRYKKGLLSSETRPQKHLHITLEAGQDTGHFGGMKVAIDGANAVLMPIKTQFQILNQKTGDKETYFKHQIGGLRLPEDVYGKPGDKNIKGTWECNIFAASKEEHDEMVALLQASGIAFVSGDPFPILEPAEPDSDGKYTIPLTIQGEVTPAHRQAHAKIFLNLIAKYLGYDEAIKPDWDFLRRYARFGEDAIKYRVAENALLPPDKEEQLKEMIDGSIVIQIFNMKGNVVGSIRFFGNQTYQYILRENASIPDENEFGFVFTDGKKPATLITGKNVARLLGQKYS